MPSRELAFGLSPSHDPEEVGRLHNETTEGVRFLDEIGDLDLRSDVDAMPFVERAALEGVLSGEEILEVATATKMLARAQAALVGQRRLAPTLSKIAQGIPDLGELQSRIEAAIGSRGEVVDGATPGLGVVRRQARAAYHEVTEALEKVIRSTAGRDALQDEVVSVRGDRLVVQVKAESRQKVPGVVHDASNTGATLFIEPFATVDMCNRWREMVLEEEREVRRVLRELSELVGAMADDIRLGVELTARLDFILARARYSMEIKGTTAEAPKAGESPVRLIDARHPMLGGSSVPISIHIGPDWWVLVITGPNTGGKTVAMKTVGLLAVMHQSGLRIPAGEGSTLPVFDGVFADIGDQQSIEQSVSTFSSHMQNVVGILATATSRSLVLLDELGTSTDPEEGSALAKAILKHLTSTRVATIATTHHRTVAAFAEATLGMTNASVDLDPKTLKPTYHVVVGVPGRSYAMTVASRLGLDGKIMSEAEELLEPQYRRFEDWLNELQNDRVQLKEKLEEAGEANAKARAARREAEARLEDMERRREEIVQSMRAELSAQFEEVRKKIRKAEGSLSWGDYAAPVRREDVEEVKQDVDEIRADIAELEQAVQPRRRPADDRPLSIGDLVDVQQLGVQGTVRSLPDENGEMEVAVGDVRLRIDIGRVRRVERPDEEADEKPRPSRVTAQLGPMLGTIELDLRGERAEDALVKVEVFLDKALRDGLSTVRIVHGKGTGVLREAVRGLLEHHPLVKSFDLEAPERGGDGATAVELM